MKKTSALLILGLLVGTLAVSKDSSAGDTDDVNSEIEQAMQEVSIELEGAREELQMEMEVLEAELSDETVTIAFQSSSDPRTPKMGVYLSDMTFKRAWEMHYPYCHGVLITGTTSEGAARKAGLMADDIVIEFDSVPVHHEDHLVSLIKSRGVGATVPVKYFRFGEEGVTSIVLQSAGGDITPLEEVQPGEEIEMPVKKPRPSVGYGGGSWYPVWYMPDFADVNNLIEGMKFSQLREEGILLHGGGGKGNIGNGWMLGGMGAGYSIDRSTKATVGTTDVIRRMRYSMGYGGVTLDKRFPLFRKITPSVGFMLGWGSSVLEFDQTDGDFAWESNYFDNTANGHLKIHKDYILFQPKATILWRFTEWLGVQVEGGYLFSYSWHSGWDAQVVEDNFEMTNSPDTSLDGYTITVGPWFGF